MSAIIRTLTSLPALLPLCMLLIRRSDVCRNPQSKGSAVYEKSNACCRMGVEKLEFRCSFSPAATATFIEGYISLTSRKCTLRHSQKTERPRLARVCYLLTKPAGGFSASILVDIAHTSDFKPCKTQALTILPILHTLRRSCSQIHKARQS